MRWFTILTVLCLVAPASAQVSDAEKVYRAMEQKVRSAKTLHVEFEGDMDGPGLKGKFKGMMDFALGGKARLELDHDLLGKAEKMLLIADGKATYRKRNDQAKLNPKPQNLEQIEKGLPGFMARVGFPIFVALGGDDSDKKPEPMELDKAFPVQDFKLGAKEKIGARNAQVVNYQIQFKNTLAKASVWIDTQTQLPLKRTLVLEEAGQTIRVGETYNSYTVDGKLDPKVFEIPKQ
jgi:outer membrane lipoprotein-sorting protein